MTRTATRPALGFLFILFGFYGAILAISSPAAFGQACASQPLEQGRVCTKPGARCSPVTVGGGDVGKCTTEGTSAKALSCECQGAPIPSYNLTVSLLTPSYLDKGVATSTITIIPFNGFTGTVNFSCAVSGVGQPAPSCTTPTPATITGGSSATSQLTVSASSSTAEATFRVTVSAVDAHGRPPDNGAQSSTVLVSHSGWIIGKSFGSAKMALVTFLVLVALWVLVYLWRSRRPASR